MSTTHLCPECRDGVVRPGLYDEGFGVCDECRERSKAPRDCPMIGWSGLLLGASGLVLWFALGVACMLRGDAGAPLAELLVVGGVSLVSFAVGVYCLRRSWPGVR